MDLSVLRKVPLFAEFDDEQIAEVGKLVQTRRVPKHQIIVYEGDPGDSFYVLLKGSVAVSRMTGEGKETILSILKEGDFFGEMALFNSSLRSASVKTLTDVEVGLITRADFLDLLGKNPSIGRSLVIALAERLREANQLIASAYQDIRSRLATLLLKLSEKFGEQVPEGLRITQRLTNQEMASMVGTTRETVNRTLNKFWDEGLIDMRTAHIVIKDVEGLGKLVQ
ncbi:MAG TPA: Crp/Fnr family transcriptional regulator [Candidatus Dormibacteraeota bacterium]|nr:Crp/Fnr family transcriptional regulator [Candidatus Dormibacteraeota bacterium]